MKFYLLSFALLFSATGFSAPLSKRQKPRQPNLVFYLKSPVLGCRADIDVEKSAPLSLAVDFLKIQPGMVNIDFDALTPEGEKIFKEFHMVPLVISTIKSENESKIRKMKFSVATINLEVELIGTRSFPPNPGSKPQDWDLKSQTDSQIGLSAIFKAKLKNIYDSEEREFDLYCTEPPGG